MSPELINPPLLRSKFSFLFGCIAELYRLHYGEKRSTKFDDIKSAVEEMKKDEKISEYLSINLDSILSKYPDLVPGRAETLSRDYLDKLCASLDFIIGDVCGEVSDLAEEAQAASRESLIAWLNGGRVS